MFRELAELGHRLESEGKLPPRGYRVYGEAATKLAWRLVIWPGDPSRVQLEEKNLAGVALPDSGRTNQTTPDVAYPLVDSAAWVLGIGGQKRRDKKNDENNAEKKHPSFLTFTEEVLLPELQSSGSEWTEVIETLLSILRARIPQQRDSRFSELCPDDWVTIEAAAGPLSDRPLFTHKVVQRFWHRYLEREKATTKSGERHRSACAICGEDRFLLYTLPGRSPKGGTLHSLNENAFVSSFTDWQRPGSRKTWQPWERTHIGVCFTCGDAALRAFNYLNKKSRHHRLLVRGKQSEKESSPLTTYTALFWADKSESVEVGKESFDPNVLLADISQGILAQPGRNQATDLAQVRELIVLPWKPKSSTLQLGDYGVYLAVLSRSKVRVIVREWLALDLAKLKESLGQFYNAATIAHVRPGLEAQPASIAAMLRHLDYEQSGHSKGPALVRALLRAAYLGHPLPPMLVAPVLQRLDRLYASRDRAERKRSEKLSPLELRPYREHALVSFLKLILTLQDNDSAMNLQYLDPDRATRPYLCGRLLYLLERIQDQSNTANTQSEDGSEGGDERLNVTVTSKYYGAVMRQPALHLGRLISLAHTAHLPKIRSNNEGAYINRSKEMDALLNAFDELNLRDGKGRIPSMLKLGEQAEFAVGYHHERARRFNRNARTDNGEDSDDNPSSN